MRRPGLFALFLVVGLVGAVGGISAAPASSAGVVVASGLANPRGMTWGADGAMYVALAGQGGDTAGVPEMPPPLGPFTGGPTGAIVRIDAGCPTVVAEGLPSSRDGLGAVIGPADVAILGDHLYALVTGGSEVFGNPGTSSGVYQIRADGTVILVADTGAWLAANPPDAAGWTAPPEGFPNGGNPFAMIADPTAGVLWVIDAINGLVLTVTPEGTITLAADLSADHPVVTGIAVAPEGGIYVGNLTAVPYTDGSAKVVHVAVDGTISDAWTGLTTVTGVAVGPDGTLYAIEMSTGNLDKPPFLQPGAGRLVHQTGPDELEEVASDLMFPVALKAGPDSALYVSLPAMGSDDGSGQILRFALGEDDATGATTAAASCA